MPQLSKYEDAATAFLKIFPIDSTVMPDDMMNWASKYKNGLASDLLIADPAKVLSAVRRHLNAGAASRNLPEASRYFIAIEDAKTKTMIVRPLADYAMQEGDQAFDKSIHGAVGPLKRARNMLENIKAEELEPEKRQELLDQIQDIVERSVPLKTLLTDQVIGHWTKKLVAKGYPAQQARDLIELAPMMIRIRKLLKATATS